MKDRAQELMEKIKRERPFYTDYQLRSREMLAREDPEYLELFHRTFMHVVNMKKNLPVKVKELIIAAVDAAKGYERGLKVHLRGALAAGATKDEVVEAMEAASLAAGIHVLSLSLPVLDELMKEQSGQGQ